MVTSITLGNAFDQNGRIIVGGGQSGFDTKSLVDSLATAKRQPAVTLETANKTIDSQSAAFTTLKSTLGALQTAVDTLRNPPGVANSSQNVFSYRTASSSTNTGVAASNYVNVSVQPGANIQTLTVDSITRLAQQTKQQSGTLTLADTTTASAVSATGTAGLFAAGTFTLKSIDGSADQSITLNTGDSLQTVVNDFNNVSIHTGIQANIVNVGNGTYKIIFSGTTTGSAGAFDLSSNATVKTDPSGALAHLGFTTTQPAQDALFSVDGVSVTRSTNSVADLISGVTFNLVQPTPVTTPPATATTITTVISPDTSIVSNAITSFADAYNKFRLFNATQTQLNSDGTPATTAVLAQDSTLRSVSSQISSEVTRLVAGITGSNPKGLADIGITLGDFAGDGTNPASSNIMSVNTDALTTALSTNFAGVQNLFQYNLSADNSALSTYARTNSLGISNFSLAIDRTAGTYVATYTDASGNTQTANLDGTPITATGGLSLAGQKGTVLEGLQLIFASTATNPSPIHVTITQGIGDRLYNALDSFLNTTNGTITSAVKNLTDKETKNKTAIAKIDADIVTYRDTITNTYAQLEAALSKANNLLQLLDSQQKARSQN